MKTMELKPREEHIKLRFIAWTIIFVLLTPAWVVPIFFVGEIVGIVLLSVILAIWLSLMIWAAIWIPAAFRVLEYAIDIDGVKMSGGVVWKKNVTVPYSKITNVDITRGPLQRYYNIGTIHVQTAGAGGQQGQKAELKLLSVRELTEAKEAIIENIRDLSYPVISRKKEEYVEEKTVFLKILEELKDIKDVLKEKK